MRTGLGLGQQVEKLSITKCNASGEEYVSVAEHNPPKMAKTLGVKKECGGYTSELPSRPGIVVAI